MSASAVWSVHCGSGGGLCPSVPLVNLTGSCSPVPGFGNESLVSPFTLPLSPLLLRCRFPGDRQQQRRPGKAGIFITLSYAEALKQLLQNKSPLRPFWSGVWLIAPGIKKSLFFPGRLAGTPGGDGSGGRHVLATCGFSVCQKMGI